MSDGQWDDGRWDSEVNDGLSQIRSLPPTWESVEKDPPPRWWEWDIDLYRDIYLKNHREAVLLKDDKDSATRQNFIRIQADAALKISGNIISRAEAEKWGRRLWEARRIDAFSRNNRYILNNRYKFWDKVQEGFYNRLRKITGTSLQGKIHITNLDNPSTLPKGALSAQNVYKYFAKASQSDISGNPNNYTKPVVVHDIETGAVVKNRSEVLSIGAIKFVYNKGLGRLEVLDTYERYYMPTVTSGSGWENAFRVHNMSPQLIASLRQQQEAKGIHYNGVVNYNDKAMLEYRQWMGHNVTLAGHNSDAFDNLQLFGENQGGYRALDTLKASRNMAYFAKGWSSKSGNKLDQVFKRLFGKTMEESGLPHHDAMSDVIATSMVLNKLANMDNKVGESIRYILASDHPDRHLTYFDNMMDSMVYKGEFQKGPTNVKSLIDRFEYHIPISSRGNMASYEKNQYSTGSWGDIGQLSPEDFDRGFTVDTNGKGVHSSSKRHQNEEDRMDQLGNLYMWLAEKNEAGAMPDDLFKFARKALNMNETSKQAESRASLKAESMMEMTSQLLHMQNMNRNMQYISRLGHFIDLTNIMPLASNKAAQEYLNAVAPSWDQSKLYNAAVDYKLERTRETLSNKDWKAFYGGKITEEQRQQLESEYRNAPKHDAMLEGFIKANKSMGDLSGAAGEASSGLEKLSDVLYDLGHPTKDIKFYDPHNFINYPYKAFQNTMDAWDWLPKSITNPARRLGDFAKAYTELRYQNPLDIFDLGTRLNVSAPKAGRFIGKWGGKILGGIGGGAIGSAISPGTGTVVGGLTGEELGGKIGEKLGGKIGESLGGIAGNGINAVSQIQGKFWERRVDKFFKSLQAIGDVAGFAYDIISIPIKLMAKAIKTVADMLNKLALNIGKFISDMMKQMAQLGTPLTNLTGVNYSQYQTLGTLDTLFGFGKGTLNSMYESTASQQHMLYAMGDYDLNRMKNAAVLGVFSEAYSPGASFDKIVNALAGKNLTPQQMAQTAQIDKNLPQILQVMSDLGIKSMSTLTDPSYLAQRGVLFRPMSDNERQRYRVDAFEYDAISTNIGNSKMRIADMMWRGFGKNIYNGLNEALDILSRNPADWGKAFDAIKKSFSKLWDSIYRISGAETKNVGDVFSSLLRKFKTEVLKMDADSSLLQKFGNWAKDALTKASPYIASAFLTIGDIFIQSIKLLYKTLRPTLQEMLNFLGTFRFNIAAFLKSVLGDNLFTRRAIKQLGLKDEDANGPLFYFEGGPNAPINTLKGMNRFEASGYQGACDYLRSDVMKRGTITGSQTQIGDMSFPFTQANGTIGQNFEAMKEHYGSYITTLANMVRNNTLAHAYAWTGEDADGYTKFRKDVEELTLEALTTGAVIPGTMKTRDGKTKNVSLKYFIKDNGHGGYEIDWDKTNEANEGLLGMITTYGAKSPVSTFELPYELSIADSAQVALHKAVDALTNGGVQVNNNMKIYIDNKEASPERIEENQQRQDRLSSYIRNRAGLSADSEFGQRWSRSVT